MPAPYISITWSSSDPSPSGVSRSFSRNDAKSVVWYVLIFVSLASASGTLR